MLNVTDLIGFGAGTSKSPITLVYNTQVNDPGNNSTYSFASVSIGTAAANRRVVIVSSANGNNAGDATGCTIAGVTAVNAASGPTVSSPGGSAMNVWYADIPTGTTATIAITYSAAKGRCQIGCYSLYGTYEGVTPYSSSVTAGTSMSFTSTTVSGSVLFGASGVGGNQPVTWTNLTEDFDIGVESNNQYMSGASLAITSGSSRTVTATYGTSVTAWMVGALFY